MILQEKPKLEERIIELLMKQPNITAAHLHRTINEHAADYSIQAIYKELRKLHSVGVIAKHGPRFALRIPWVLNVAALVEEMKQHYVDEQQFDHLLLAPGKKKIWHFTNLNILNNFWSQVLLVVINQAKDKRIYGYSPHPWYHLLQTEQEDQYIQSLRHSGARLYLMMGGRTFLDKWATKYWPKSVVEYSFAESPYEQNRGWYFDLIDDYLVSVKLDATTIKAIETLYENTVDWEQLDLAKVLLLAQTKVKASLWLEHNPQKADAIRKRFAKFFGV